MKCHSEIRKSTFLLVLGLGVGLGSPPAPRLTPGAVAGEGTAAPAAPEPCPVAPPHAQPADSHYSLHISGEPDLFIPAEIYTVSLIGVDSGEGPTPFTGFTMWVELVPEDSPGSKQRIDWDPTANHSLGSLQVKEAQTKPLEQCTPAVTNATSHPKVDVQVTWTPPRVAVELCVRVCARVGPWPAAAAAAAPGSEWSVLARKLCAAPIAPATHVRQMPITEPCCACDEAKYELTFEGTWSRNTHPKDFPAESARPHLSDIIAVSHSGQYRLWQEGRIASTGFKKMLDDGSAMALEKELKSESDNIRTVIKARFISPTTYAVFRVDSRKHLFSLATKLTPSPDWFIGVSALELCDTNCTWRSSVSLPLFPYDAGTDNGLTYLSPRDPAVPPVAVRAIRPDWPDDARAPFHNPRGTIIPLATIRVSRMRLYQKSCDAVESSVESQSEPSEGSCSVLEWGPWSACSVTCGRGSASRQRHYVWPQRAYADGCRVSLTDRSTCWGPRRHCRGVSEYEPEPAAASGPCGVSAWGAWSACSGCGVRARSRHYLAPRARKRCHVGYRARTELHQAMPCPQGVCQLSQGIPDSGSNLSQFDKFFVDYPVGECQVTAWGAWSPCSAACGPGSRLRTRLYVVRDTALQQRLVERLLERWNQHYSNTSKEAKTTPATNSTAQDIEDQAEEHLRRCGHTLVMQESLCRGEQRCPRTRVSREICLLPLSVGPCRNYEERWFFDANKSACEPFGYTGCGGNDNNFVSREECMQACGNETAETTAGAVAEATTAKPVKKSTNKTIADNLLNDSNATDDEKDSDCILGEWMGWSECRGDCDRAFSLNYRFVLNQSTGKGRQCSDVIQSRPCLPDSCHTNHTTIHN